MRGCEELDIKSSRHTLPVLVVCGRGVLGTPLRHAVAEIGFAKISSRNSYELALDEAKAEQFSFIFFDAFELPNSSISTIEFIEEILKHQKKTIMVAVALEPTAENIFKVIRYGARGYLVPPVTPESAEIVLLRATEDPEISPAILAAEDRNAALSGYILDHLDRLAMYMSSIHHALVSGSQPSLEEVVAIDRHSVALSQSMYLGRKFCEGDESLLTDALADECMRRGQKDSQLRQTRRRLQKERQH